MITGRLKHGLLGAALLLMAAGVQAQERTTLDWQLHDAGSMRQVVTNTGGLNTGISGYGGLINSEFPVNSFEEHIGEGGIWVGAISPEGDTLVSTAEGAGWGQPREFYPGGEPSDSIWTIRRGATVDIPFLSEPYTGVSDQDFVMKYSDYTPASMRVTNHRPLYVDVVQTSYAWSSPPLDEIIVYNYAVIPTRFDLKQAFIGFWMDANVGYTTGAGWAFAEDDWSEYYSEHRLGVGLDSEGGSDGTASSPIGHRVFAPEGYDEDALTWTFMPNYSRELGNPPVLDGEKYAEMASGQIERQLIVFSSQYYIAMGPFDVALGDTLRFSIAQIVGEGLEGMMDNVQIAEFIKASNFKVPAPPPPPPLRVETDNQRVTLRWKAQPGDVDPETFTDPNRADGVEQPFEGYRVYKSTKSINGPWSLLAKYDIPDNTFDANSGLKYEYVDDGLVNNVEYFYTVTAFSKPDTAINFPSQESSQTAFAKRVVPGSAPPETVGQVRVVPNPYRGDVRYQSYNPPWEKPPGSREVWLEQDRRIQFINLPARCEINIYTLSGTHVNRLQHDHPTEGYEDWNLTSSVGQAVASGIYLFTVEDLETGQAQVGKFVIIK